LCAYVKKNPDCYRHDEGGETLDGTHQELEILTSDELVQQELKVKVSDACKGERRLCHV
jgi:hypothetical protein